MKFVYTLTSQKQKGKNKFIYIFLCKMDKLLVHLHQLFGVKFITWPNWIGQANWWLKMVLRSWLMTLFFSFNVTFFSCWGPWSLKTQFQQAWLLENKNYYSLFFFTRNEMWWKIKLKLWSLHIYKVYQLHKKNQEN